MRKFKETIPRQGSGYFQQAFCLAALLLWGVLPQVQGQVVEAPGNPLDGKPTHQELVYANHTLTWSFGTENILTNGGFEEGLTNWSTQGTIVTEPASSMRGTNHLLIAEPRNASTEISIPSDIGRASLSFITRRLPLGWLPHFRDGQFLTAELLDEGRSVILLNDFPSQGSYSYLGWTRYIVDISDLVGKRVRLKWNHVINTDAVPLRLDDVRIVPVAEDTEFDVWLSVSPQPLKLLGRTSRPSWPLYDLRVNTLYNWRVDAVRNVQTNIGQRLSFQTARHDRMGKLSVTLPERIICFGDPIPLQIKVEDHRGFPPAPKINPIKLEVIADNATVPSVKITEISTAGMWDAVEFQNVTTNTIDISSWKIDYYQDDRTTFSQRLNIPVGFTLQPGDLLLLKRGGPDNQTNWLQMISSSVDWIGGNSLVAAGVVIRDAKLNVIDSAFFEPTIRLVGGVPRPRQSTNVSAIDWRGLPNTNRPNTGLSFQRVGNQDNNQAADWLLAPASIGTNNTGLILPFIPGYGRVPIVPDVVSTSNIWNGFVQFDLPASNITIFASTTNDVGIFRTQTEPFDIVTDLCLVAEAPAEILENAGTVPGALKIRLPAVQTTNVIVQLSGVTNRLVLPSEVVIPAGSEEVAVDITVLDNDLLDGYESQPVRVSSYGFAPTWIDIAVADDELATLSFLDPASTVNEGSFRYFTVLLDKAPVRDIYLWVSSSDTNRFSVPSRVLLRAGTVSANFSVATRNNDVLDGATNSLIQVSHPGWNTIATTIEIFDDENLDMIAYPWQVTSWEGNNQAILIKLGSTLPTNTAMVLSTSAPHRLSSPTNVVIPANTREFFVQLLGVEDLLPNGSTNVTVHLSAPPFNDTEVVLAVYDDDPGLIFWEMPPGPHFVGSPVTVNVRLTTLDGNPVAHVPMTNAILSGVTSAGSLSISNSPLAVNGQLYSTTITFLTVAPDARLRLQIGEIVAETFSFQVWSNAPVADVQDALYDPVHDRIIIASTNNAIYALEPGTGLVQNNHIAIHNPTLLALSDDQETLHAVFEGGKRIARIKLSSFEVQADWSLGEVNGEPLVVDHLIPVPGEPESLLIARRLLSANVLHDVAVFEGATPRAQTASIPYGLPTTLGFATDKQKAFVTFQGMESTLKTLRVSTNGVEEQVDLWTLRLFGDRWARPGDHIFFGDILFSADIETVDPHLSAFVSGHLSDIVLDNVVTVDPLVGHFASHTHYRNQGLQRLTVFDSFLMREIGQQTYPPFVYVNKLVPAGNDRWMYLGNNRFYLATLPTPEPAPATDLGITSEVTVIEPNTKSAQVTFRITNNGTNMAPDTALVFGLAGGDFFRPSDVQMVSLSTNAVATDRALGGQLYELGDLAPGESKEVQGVFKAVNGERLAVSAYVGSTAKELSLADNRTQVSIDDLLRIPSFALQTNLDSQESLLKLQFLTQAGISYQIEHSASISGPWEPHGAAITGDGEPFVLEIDTSSAATSFWRVIAH